MRASEAPLLENSDGRDVGEGLRDGDVLGRELVNLTSLIPRRAGFVERVGKQSWRVRQDPPTGPALVLEIVRIDRSSWRISANPIAEGQLPRLLGFVERLDRDRFRGCRPRTTDQRPTGRRGRARSGPVDRRYPKKIGSLWLPMWSRSDCTFFVGRSWRYSWNTRLRSHQ